MADLHWSWLAAPYFICTLAIVAVAIVAAMIRGDRVLRLGVIGAATTALPWALCQALAACTDDPSVATRLLRVGQGPVALVGPMLLLVLLGASGQLERRRWIVRLAGVVGFAFCVIAWATTWTVPGVQRVPLGMYYVSVGPLTGLHISLLVVWLAVGLWIVRKSTARAERRRSTRLVLGVLICGAIGSLDTFLLYGVWGIYPIAWFPATIACGIALYLCLRTDLLRPQGFDRAVGIEMLAFVIATAATCVVALSSVGRSPPALAISGAAAWIGATALAWALGNRRPVRVAGERALEQFVARIAAIDNEKKIADRVAELWRTTTGVALRAVWSRDGDVFAKIGETETRRLAPEAVDWLAQFADPLALTDLATMRLGLLRGPLEELGSAHRAGWIVPLVDRDELVGFVEADYDRALREDARGLIAESARAAARALTFVQLARAASRERDTTREVEIADALRLQASASRDAEMNHWVVTGEYRSAPRTTGAGWSAIELADGRLALLVTEAQAHGVAAALATAALTGAFAAATTSAVTLGELITMMRASADGVMRGGEPVAAFLAIFDQRTREIEWACAGHPGALLVGPIAVIEPGVPDGSSKGPRPQVTVVGTGTRQPDASLSVAMRGKATLLEDSLLVVASTALRGTDDTQWQKLVSERARAAARLATVLVETAAPAGPASEDLLVVVVRAR